MKTIGKLKGYSFESGAGGKSWTRGNVKISEGRKWVDNNKSVPCLVKTQLDTGKMEEASVKEYKKFLTEESYKEYLLTKFVEISKADI